MLHRLEHPTASYIQNGHQGAQNGRQGLERVLPLAVDLRYSQATLVPILISQSLVEVQFCQTLVIGLGVTLFSPCHNNKNPHQNLAEEGVIEV